MVPCSSPLLASANRLRSMRCVGRAGLLGRISKRSRLGGTCRCERAGAYTTLWWRRVAHEGGGLAVVRARTTLGTTENNVNSMGDEGPPRS